MEILDYLAATGNLHDYSFAIIIIILDHCMHTCTEWGEPSCFEAFIVLSAHKCTYLLLYIIAKANNDIIPIN